MTWSKGRKNKAQGRVSSSHLVIGVNNDEHISNTLALVNDHASQSNAPPHVAPLADGSIHHLMSHHYLMDYILPHHLVFHIYLMFHHQMHHFMLMLRKFQNTIFNHLVNLTLPKQNKQKGEGATEADLYHMIFPRWWNWMLLVERR